ncbi:MAG TPA: PHP-associated domain-containing protein [Bryobacteraceae bacterium]|nr:PHP-associated domain-containing protein [Bryobacteraceae bacterium]
MRCDLHVHTVHSGRCTVPLLKAVCRESYNAPEEVYERLKRLGMDLVTITDHDSIDAVEALRGRPDFFLSEEVTCRLPSGTEMHVGVYDLNDRQHVEIQRRREDFPALAAYLRGERLFFTANHIFSSLTGARALEDFDCFEAAFPAFETRNSLMLAAANERAAGLAGWMGKGQVGGSDAHAMPSVGRAWTEVPGARDKHEFLAGLRRGLGRVHGECGNYWKLTRDVLLIGGSMVRENPATLPLAPLALAVPLVTLANFILESWFARRWMGKVQHARMRRGGSLAAGRAPVPEAAA